MFSFFTSLGASSNFEKHRLILTSKNYEAPDQSSLKRIIETFRGEDEETRSQIAFATIIKKIHTSDSNENWIYLLKNLIIFDRIVQENCFLQEISTLHLKPIQNYEEKNENAKALNSQNILKFFWRLIQFKSSLLSQTQIKKYDKIQVSTSNNQRSKREYSFSKKPTVPAPQKQKARKYSTNISQNATINNLWRSILSVFRSQKQQFLKTLNVQQIYKQSVQLQNLFQHIFTVIASIDFNSPKVKNKKIFKTNQQDKNNDRGPASKRINQTNKLFKNIHINAQNNNQSYRKFFPLSLSPEQIQSNNEYNQKYKFVREEFVNSRLVMYLHLQLLYKLLSVYSNQLICIRMFISRLLQQSGNTSNLKFIEISQNITNFQVQIISQKEINLWRKIICNFLLFSQKIINYVQNHKNIRGFELINYQQLSPFQNENILGVLDDYIQHKNTLQEPGVVKVQELGMIMDVNNHIKVDKKAQYTCEKTLTPRKAFIASGNTIDKNNPFENWHNGYSINFPPKEVLTVDLIMDIRQKPLNPATQFTDEDDQQSIYQPFIANRHSCIYNFRESNISAISEFQFIPLDQMQRKNEEILQCAVSRKNKNFYYFRSGDQLKSFKNIYSSLSKEDKNVWVR